MNKDFNQVNKQIAGFIIVSAAVMAPVIMPDASGIAQANPVTIQGPAVSPVMRYAGPGMLNPADIIERYAGPQMPLPVVRYAGPQMPIMPKYAGPEMPAPADVIARYAGPQIPAADVNLNLNQNVNVTPSVNVTPNLNNNVKPAVIDNNFGLIKLDAGHYIFK